MDDTSDRVIIVGGGLAGSILALVLGRAGRAVVLIDPKRAPTPDFRNEKLDVDQVRRVEALGLLSCFQAACWGADEPEIAADPRRPGVKDCGARYDQWIGRIREALPASVAFVEAKVDRIDAADDRQTVTLTSGAVITGRLVVLATGHGERLRASLGVSRKLVSERHSLSLGFSVAPPAGDPWRIQADIWQGRAGDRLSYTSVFPMGGEVRINVFAYRDLDDPWVREMRQDPVGLLSRTVPQAQAVLAGLAVTRPLEVRSTDLHGVEGHVRPGVVLIGDSFQTTCPAGGAGLTRILNDVDRLANAYLPGWMATPGMGAAKIAAFYADPVKQRLDQAAMRASLNGRGVALGQSPLWRARRRLGVLKRTLLPDRTRPPRLGEGDQAVV